MKSKRKTKKTSIQTRRKNFVAVVAIIILLFFVFGYVFNPPSEEISMRQENDSKSLFAIEGSLDFLSAGDTLITNIKIEIADDEYSRQKGLMYRHYIPDTLGMLFIFQDERYRSFWMKNTPSSLDIYYVNSDFEIVKIHENTLPYSEGPIPSDAAAKYVVEVVAGFTAQHNIKAGDKIRVVKY